MSGDQVVVLGASNVARAVADITAIACGYRAGPIELFLAGGHGRSYGASSRVLWRELPGLHRCGLWDALDASPHGGARLALITDVGNDLLYGESAERVGGWVERLAERLRERSFRLCIAELPMDSISQLGRRRFIAARTLLFPTSPLQFADLGAVCGELNDRLRSIAARCDAQLVVPQPDWYGLDPIHIRYAVQRRAWCELLRAFQARADAKALALTRVERRRIRRARHAERLYLGRHEHRAQPVVTLENGSRVSLF